MQRPKLKRDWEGLLVLTTRALQTNGGTVFPTRTVMKVSRNHGGLTLEAVEACDKCRIRHKHRIKGVSENDVMIIDDDTMELVARDNRAINYLLRSARNFARSRSKENDNALIVAALDFGKLDTVIA